MQPDKLRALRVVDPAQLAAVRDHFREVLGWEEAFFVEEPERGAMATYTYGGSAIVLATPGAFGVVPHARTQNAVALIEIPHVEQLHALLSARASEAVGALSTIPLVDYRKEELAKVAADADAAQDSDPDHATRYFDVRDPSGSTVRFVEARPQGQREDHG